MAKLSVIIPVYNVEKYLSECLDSIINQTFKDLEIICVNDGSTDNSLRILEEYAQKDNRIKIVNKENGGLSSARNAGMNVATGEYYAFIDSDDILDNDAYEKSLEHINDADLVHFGIKVFGDSNYAQRGSDEIYYKIKFKGIQKLNSKAILNSDVSSCNKIFKKSIIEQNNITFPDGLNYEDAEFYFKYVSCSNTAYYLNEKFYNYRRSGDSIMSNTFNGSEKAIHHLYIVKNIFEFWQKNHYIENNEKLFVETFKNFFNFAYWNSKVEQRPKVLYIASEYAKEFSNSIKIKTNFVRNLAKKHYGEIFVPDLKFYQKIYKKVEVFHILDRCKKEYTWLFGFEFKKQHKDIDILRRLNSIEDKIRKIENNSRALDVKSSNK